MFVLLCLAACQVHEFVNTETAQFFQFCCNDSLTLTYMAVEKIQLRIRSSREDIVMTGAKMNEASASASEIALGMSKKGGFYESDLLDLEGDAHTPWNLTITCKTTEATEFCGISPIVEQSVLGNGAILVMGFVGVGMVGFVIAIVLLQFCTFHRKKYD